MKKQLLIFALALTLLVLLLAGCNTTPGPEDVYQRYWEACSQGKFSQAEGFLADNAREISQSLGVCALTHDAINTLEAQKGNPPRTFSGEPLVNAREKATSITWFDDQGNIATVILVLIDGEWKVTEATWSR
jgi:predicted small secreted protein